MIAFRFPLRNSYMAIVAATSVLASGQAYGQVSADSISAWTALLGSTSLAEKSHAYERLGGLDPVDVPGSTRVAIQDELIRLHQEFLNDAGPLLQSDEAEGFGEAYMSLILLVSRFNTTEARLALIGAIDLSAGIQRQVARLGELAFPTLELMVGQDAVTAASAYSTMGLGWFWADSTGAALTDASRGRVLSLYLEGIESPEVARRFGAATALSATGDPAFLPLAINVAEFELAEGNGVVGRSVNLDVLPLLEAAIVDLTAEQLSQRTQRLTNLLCSNIGAAICVGFQADFDAALQAVQTGDDVQAVLLLQRAIAVVDGALESGTITRYEHAILAGGARQVIDLKIPIRLGSASADTYLRQGPPNSNQGAESIIQIRQSVRSRGLVRFDDATFAGLAGRIVSARIEANIVFNANNWGRPGQTVSAYRMLVDWSELGATWQCAVDDDTSNQRPNCDTDSWEMRTLDPPPYDPTPSGTLRVTNDLLGTVSFDVTEDVRAIAEGRVPNYGWILKRTDERRAGHMHLASRETETPPRLVVEILLN